MMEIDWLNYIVSILSVIAAAIPLVFYLIQYVKEAVKQRNWQLVLNWVIDLMQAAETKFEQGADRKEWVLTMLKANADCVNYDIDYDAIADMIDSLCCLSKAINGGESAHTDDGAQEELGSDPDAVGIQ